MSTDNEKNALNIRDLILGLIRSQKSSAIMTVITLVADALQVLILGYILVTIDERIDKILEILNRLDQLNGIPS